MKQSQQLTPDLFLQYQQKAVFFALVCLGMALFAHPFYKKLTTKESKQQKQIATVIDYRDYVGNHPYPMVRVLLDTDGNKETAESICDVALENTSSLNHEDLKQILPVGTTRTMWEWNKIGQVSKVHRH